MGAAAAAAVVVAAGAVAVAAAAFAPNTQQPFPLSCLYSPAIDSS